MRLAVPLALLSLSGVLGSQPTVRVADSGAVVSGYYKTNAAGGRVQVFQGIPYAEPRVGKQRFTQTKVQAITRDLNATAHGSICYGAPRLDAASGQYPPSEDCLYLNVYAPAGATSQSKLPVMVWVHGGGFIAGAANPYDGTDLVGVGEQDVVVVTFNYRLSVFGYLSNKEVLAQGDGSNFGMRDQEVAFAWVKKYIADFGGNPEDVTAVGESAGSISLALHMVSREGKQTWFNKAIMQSGGYGSSSDSNAKQEEVKVALAKAVGCPTDTSLDCLRTIDAAKLFAAADPLNGWFPTVDGVYMYDQPIRRVLAGKVSRIPTISGTNTDDGYYFSLGGGSDNAATFNSYLQKTYPLLTSLDLSLIGSLYPEKDFGSAQLRTSELRNDQMFVCPSELLSMSLSVTTPAYRYRFNDASNRTFGIPLVLHAEDLNYVFNRTAQLPATPTSRIVTSYIMKFWTNFIRFGNPNGKPQQQQQQSAKRAWPLWNALTQQQIVLQEPLTAERSGAYTNQHAARCAFWYSYDLRAAAGAAVPLKK